MPTVTFPKIGEKHRLVPLFTAEHTMKGWPKIPERVIFTYSTGALGKKLKEVLKLRRYIHNIGKGGAWKTQNFITSDKKLLIANLPMGAPVTAATLEEAIVCGGKEFLIIGAAGGLGVNLAISDMILCERAIRDEGTSHHYLRNSKYSFPDQQLTRRLSKAITQNGIKFYKGTTWTIDAPYVETKEEIKHYRKEGVLTVEMEAAAFFAVAKRRKVKAAAVFTISDLLAKEWTGFVGKDYKRDGYSKLAKIAKLFKEL